MAWGLAIASAGAILGWSRADFNPHGFTTPKLLVIAVGVVVSLVWSSHLKTSGRFEGAAIRYALSWIPSVAFATDIGRAFVGFPGYYTGGAIPAGLSVAGLFAADKLDESGRVLVRRAILAAGILTALLCVYQNAGADPFRFGLPYGNRAVGLLGSPIDAGAVFVALIAIAPLSCVPLLFAGIMATASRGAMLAALVSLFPMRYRTGAAIAAIICAVGYASFRPNPSESDRGRRELWSVAAQSISVTGTGPATFYEVFEKKKSRGWETYHQAGAHNAILEAAVTRGLFGVMGLMAIAKFPRMAGIWVISMLNPISFEVSFLACVLTGLYPDGKERGLT